MRFRCITFDFFSILRLQDFFSFVHDKVIHTLRENVRKKSLKKLFFIEMEVRCNSEFLFLLNLEQKFAKNILSNTLL